MVCCCYFFVILAPEQADLFHHLLCIPVQCKTVVVLPMLMLMMPMLMLLLGAFSCLGFVSSVLAYEAALQVLLAGKVSEPEIFPRADGTVWCCGENSMVTPPEDPLKVLPRPGAPAAIQVGQACQSCIELLVCLYLLHSFCCFSLYHVLDALLR